MCVSQPRTHGHAHKHIQIVPAREHISPKQTPIGAKLQVDESHDGVYRFNKAEGMIEWRFDIISQDNA